MEKYDVVIIGGGLGSLTTAAYLSKRLRNVAVFEEGSKKKLQKYTNRLKDEFNNKFDFKFYNYDVGGVHEGDLFFGSLDDARGAPHHHELLLLGREVFKAAIAELDVVGELFAALESHDLDPLGGHAGEGEQLCLEV